MTSNNNDQILTVILITRRYLNFQRNFSVVGYSQLHVGRTQGGTGVVAV